MTCFRSSLLTSCSFYFLIVCEAFLDCIESHQREPARISPLPRSFRFFCTFTFPWQPATLSPLATSTIQCSHLNYQACARIYAHCQLCNPSYGVIFVLWSHYKHRNTYPTAESLERTPSFYQKIPKKPFRKAFFVNNVLSDVPKLDTETVDQHSSDKNSDETSLGVALSPYHLHRPSLITQY